MMNRNRGIVIDLDELNSDAHHDTSYVGLGCIHR